MQRLTELILNEITARIDTLSAEQAREVVAALHEKYASGAGDPNEVKSTLAKPRTEPASLTTELPLGAGAELQFTSLSSAPSLDSEIQLSEMTASSPPRLKTVAAPPRQTDISAIVETKPIVDDAKEVTAIATPDIAANHEAIVDEAKEVTAIKTPKIASAAPPIVDDTPDVRELKTAKIVGTAKPIVESTAAPLKGITVPSARTSGLRASHVVQPTPDVDDVIEAELISVDGDDDAIMIVKEKFRRTR